MADKAMSAMSIDSSIGGTERLLAQGADGSIIVTATLAAYVIDVLVAAAEAVPTTGDAILMERSGTEGTFDIDDLAAYVIATGWSVASEADPAASGDMLLVERSGTIYEVDVDTLTDYVLTGVQASVWNLSAIGAATLTGSDLFGVCQTTTLKAVTLDNLETKLWADFKSYVEGRTEIATAVDSDLLYAIQGGVAKGLTLDDLAVYMSAEIITIGDVLDSAVAAVPAWLTALTEDTSPAAADELLILKSGTGYKITMSTIANYAMDATFDLPWKLIESSKYTALPASTSTLTMSDTTDISIGDPVKFVWSGVTYYAVVTGKVANTQITIAGAPFNPAVPITALYVGTTLQLATRTIWISDLFGDAVQDLLSLAGRYERWEGPPAYLVAFAATAGTADTGASQPKINIKIDSNAVSTDDSAKGLQVSGTPGTWTANSAVEIDPTYYGIERGDAIEVRCTEAGTNADAADLSLTLTFVYE